MAVVLSFKKPEVQRKLRRLVALLDRAADAVDECIALGDQPPENIPIDVDAMLAAASYLTEIGFGADGQQLLERTKYFFEHATVIFAIRDFKKGLNNSIHQACLDTGVRCETPLLDTSEQQENELLTRWSRLRREAEHIRISLSDLRAHLISELKETDELGRGVADVTEKSKVDKGNLAPSTASDEPSPIFSPKDTSTQTEKKLIPLVQLLLMKRIWQFSDLPNGLKAERNLQQLKNCRWIEFRLSVLGYMLDWTTDCELSEWFQAASAGHAVFEVGVSRKGIGRLDELELLQPDEKIRFQDFLGRGSESNHPETRNIPLPARSGVRRALHETDKQVLSAIARFGRGFVIETSDADDADGDDWQADGKVDFLEWMPELFLQLEFKDTGIEPNLAGSLLVLTQRGLIGSKREVLRVPAKKNRFRLGSKIWYVGEGPPYICNPSKIKAPSFSVWREDGWSTDGFGTVPWYRVTSEGWELVDSMDAPTGEEKEQATDGDSGDAGGPDPHSGTVKMQPPLKRPPENAFIAWRLRDLRGLTKQREIADAMSEQLGRRIDQGQVSRWLAQVEEYRRASGIFPELHGLSSQPQSIDPDLIEMGARQDGLTSRQRQRSDPDAE